MNSDTKQRKTFDFFVAHLSTMEPFTKKEMQAATTWPDSSFRTYWSKQFKPFVIERPDGRFRVSEAFRQYSTWEKFQRHVTQVRRLASSDYQHVQFDFVRIYEFFMPLSNEEHLRTALDALFYRDRVRTRLKTLSGAALQERFPATAGETDDAYLERICNWISDRFGGYSVYHVNGPFRADRLRPMAERGVCVKVRGACSSHHPRSWMVAPGDRSLDAPDTCLTPTPTHPTLPFPTPAPNGGPEGAW